MKVLICGGGAVGRAIAERLADERNSVTMVDLSSDVLARLSDELDVATVMGHGSHPDVLDRAGAADCDILFAVTPSDEVNITACTVSHTLFNVPTKIARLRAAAYRTSDWADLFARDRVPVDATISPDIEVAEAIARLVTMPGVGESGSFCRGQVLGFSVECLAGSAAVAGPLHEVNGRFPGLDATVVGKKRDGKVSVVGSEHMLEPGDVAYVVAATAKLGEVLAFFGHDMRAPRRVIIAGSGHVGVHAGGLIGKALPDVKVRFIDTVQERALSAAQALPHSLALLGSALDETILRDAGVGGADMFFAASNDDAANLLSGALAKKLGSRRSASLLSAPGYRALIGDLKIDAAIDPTALTVSKALRHIRRGKIRALLSLEQGRAEMIEAEALAPSALVGKPLRDLDITEGIRIGAVFRQGEVLAPTGDTVIAAHDRLVVFATAAKYKEVEQIFRVSLEFF
jgi:trk system potassium uptake protein TrkA